MKYAVLFHKSSSEGGAVAFIVRARRVLQRRRKKIGVPMTLTACWFAVLVLQLTTV